MGSIWGNFLKISIFGESHGNGIGAVIDGFPSGVLFDKEFVLSEMKRRAPGKNKQSTKRQEKDIPKILSGIYNGYTTGTPISLLIENTDTKSGDYNNFTNIPRPGHADYTGEIRYNGFNDPRGGGHFSGRLTAPLTFCGALCKLYLKTLGITIGSHIQSIGQIQDAPFDDTDVTASEIEALRKKEYPIINPKVHEYMLSLIEEARLKNDSIGGVIECAIIGMPVGIGSPIMDTVESKISSLLFSVPAVKGVEFGAGFSITNMMGSEANDNYVLENDEIRTETNNNGGILGGITNGMPIIIRTAIKPTPSVLKKQSTLNIADKTITQLSVLGRHDPCIVTRAAPVIEAACAIAISDLILEAKGYA